jgi:hypothetical protein
MATLASTGYTGMIKGGGSPAKSAVATLAILVSWNMTVVFTSSDNIIVAT